MQQKQIDTPNGKIAYWISEQFEESRKTLFFLHGLTADHTMFEPQLSFFESDFNLIAWDAPAHGESRPFTDFSFENAANGIREIINRCAVSEAIFIGQSMGGFIVQAFLCRYPERVRAFVAVDSTPYGNYYSKSDMRWLRKVERLSKLFPEKLLKSAVAKQVAVTEAGRKNMTAMLSNYGKLELCHLMGIGYTCFLDDNRELNISCPTLLIVGKKDRTGKVIAYNKAWAKRTGFPLLLIPNAAHNSNVDNPSAVNCAVWDFIAQLP